MSREPARDALWSALLAACRTDPAEVTDFNRPQFLAAARALMAASASPSEVIRRANLMRGAFTVPITPKLLASHFTDFPPTPRPTSGVFYHPTRCPVPCSGCAADRKGLAG